MQRWILLRRGLAAILIAASALALGAYLGEFFATRSANRALLDNSLLQIYNNLRIAKNIREGKTSDAIELLDSINSANLVVIKGNDSLTFNDPKYLAWKKKVLAALGKEWKEHPEVWNAIFNRSFRNEPDAADYQKFRQELEQYLNNSVK
jgi:hypothetical protein